MAIPIRFQTTWENTFGDVFTVRFLDTLYMGVITAQDFSVENFTITYNGDASGRDRFQSVIPSQCTISLLWDETNTRVQLFKSELIQYQENRFYIEIWKGDTVNAPTSCIWRGKIVQDLITEADAPFPRFITITASCGLNSLDAFNMTEPGYTVNTLRSLITILTPALDLNLWGNSEEYLRTVCEWYEVQMGGVDIDPIRHSRFDYSNVFYELDSDGNKEWKTMLECLEIICKAWGARLFMSDGRWNFIQVAQYKNSTININSYTKLYVDVLGPDASAVNILQENEPDVVRIASVIPLTGGEFTYLPAVQSVTSNFDYEDFLVIGGGYINLTPTLSAPLIIGAVLPFGSNGLKITLQHIANLTYNVFAPYFTGNVNFQFVYTIRIGQYYLNNSYAWTLTPSTVNITVPLWDNVGDLTCNVQTQIITATIPTNGNLRLEGYYVVPTAYAAAGVAGTMTLGVGATYNSQNQQTGTTFTATNSTNPKSSIKVDLGDVLLGDLPDSTGKHTLSVYDGIMWQDAENWRIEDVGTSYTFGQLLTLDYLRGQLKPTEKYSGEIIGNFTFYNTYLRDSKTWMFLNGEFNGRLSTWRGDWVETKYESTGATIDPNISFLPPLKYAGGILPGNTISAINDINSIGTIGAPLEVDDNVTSLTINTLPYDLATGAKITIINNNLQAQTFTLTSAASAGNDVVLSVGENLMQYAFPIDSNIILTGNDVLNLLNIGAGSVSQLADLSDVDGSVATPSDGNILVYRESGGDWVLEAKPAAGANPALDDVTNVTLTSVANNEVLAYDSTTGQWINQTASEAGLAAATHTHAASDVVSGTFADARIAQTNVTQHQAALTVASTQVTGLGALATKSAVNDADWSGTDLSVLNGGTGASTATEARTNLGVAIGVDVQAYSAILAATTASFTTAKDSKLTGIEAGADVTDTANVTSAGAVMVTGAQTVEGIKTFVSSPIVPAPIADLQAATKKYVDDTVTAAGGFTAEDAQDAVGAILTDTATIDFTYNDAGGTITADVKDASIGASKLSVGVNGSLSLAETATQPSDLATVATTGVYNDLSGKPTLGTLAALNTVNDSNWSGTDLSVLNGGTGSSTAAGARTNLGLVIGTNVQAYSAILAATTASFTTALSAEIAANTAKISFDAASSAKLATIETGAEVNNISDLNATDLTDGGDATLHFHSTDRSRANHTGTQLSSTISNFAATVRTTVLTGLSLASSATVSAVDSILAAIGKLQAQVSLKANSADLGDLAVKDSVNDADWSGADLSIVNGGTGASTATEARTNLGLVIGVDVQAYSAILAATTASFTTADETKLDAIIGTNTGDQDLSALALKTNVLEKNNTTVYTPVEDYHPATKIYVDNEINDLQAHTVVTSLSSFTYNLNTVEVIYIVDTAGIYALAEALTYTANQIINIKNISGSDISIMPTSPELIDNDTEIVIPSYGSARIFIDVVNGTFILV